MPEASDPPRITRCRHCLPVVEGIAPQLAARAEVVRRYAGDHQWVAALVQLEQVLMSPNVGAVVGNKDRDVAHDEDAERSGPGADGKPLFEKHHLAENVKVNLFADLLAGARDRTA